MRLDIKKKNVLALPKTASRLAVRSYKNISSVDFDVRPLQRIHYLLIATLVLTPTLSTLYLELRSSKLYALTKEEKSIVASTSVKKELIKTTEDAYTYNRKEELKGVPNGSDPKLQELLLSANKTDSTGKEPYQASLSKDPTKGLTFGDAEGNRQFTLTPNFGLSEAKLDDESRVVYPVSTTERSIYTFKKNGIKNDITLLEAPKADPNTNGTTKTYKYTLSLGKDLEARLLPSGDVGIYSADPTLFGNIQVGDQKSQELVDQARNNGEKNTLAFEIPKPFIIDSSKKMNYDDVSFKLEPNQKDPTKPTLVLEVRNLKNLSYPLSIDPTITVTTTNDFQANTGDTGNVDFSTSGQISRAAIGSGAVGSTSSQSSSFITKVSHTSIVYNGYLYAIGGGDSNGTPQNDIVYCTINANGSVGTCTQQTNAFTGGRVGHASVVYNGYLYIIGGSATGYQNDIQYCPINANGSVGTCTQQTNAFTGARVSHASVVYNGYLYIIGGFIALTNTTCNSVSSNYCNDIQYCTINANGSVGTCTQQTNAFTGARYYHSSIVYNNYVYIIGGNTGAGVDQNDIQYCPINANGSVGTCTQQTNAFTGARRGHSSVFYNGYVYIIGGNIAGAPQNDIHYCPINANGSIGTCTQQTNAFTNGRSLHTSAVYNGYIYVLGGEDYNSNTLGDIQGIKISSVGAASTATQQTAAFTNARAGHTSVIYNGYAYVIGGNNPPNFYNDIHYCPINANGSVSTCTQQTNAFTTARTLHTSVVYNGYLYIIGGIIQTAGITCNPVSSTYCNDIQYCPINANGSIGTCTQQTNAFTTARNYHTSVVYNGYLYIIGGYGGSFQNDIQYCPINANGSVGTCTQQTNAFITARTAHTSVAYNNYLYIIGGQASGAVNQNDIQYCPINANGSVGTCTQQINAFTIARYGHSTLMYNGYLYIIGGSDNDTYNDIQYCPINANGSVGTCTQQTNAFTTGRSFQSAIVYNGYVYIIGGFDVIGNRLNDIQYLRIGPPDGTRATTFTTNTNRLLSARFNNRTIAYNGFLYTIGGAYGDLDFSYDLTDIERCPINNNGSLGTCISQPGMLNGININFSAVVAYGNIYIIGGTSVNSLIPQDQISKCPINANGSVTACSVVKQGVFPSGVMYDGFSSVIYGSYIYSFASVVNGVYTKDIVRCPILSDGGIGACAVQTNILSTTRRYYAAAAYNGYIYLTGGWDQTTTYLNDIEKCSILADGTIGSCSRKLNAYKIGRGSPGMAVSNGTIYIAGGFQTSYTAVQDCKNTVVVTNGCNDILAARIEDSVVGKLNLLGYFSTARQVSGFATYRGYIYLSGGYDFSAGGGCNNTGVNLSYCNDIVYAPILATSYNATYERTIDTTSSANTIGSFVILGSANCSYNVTYSTAGATNAFGSKVLIQTFPGVNVPVTTTNARYLRISISLDDSTCGSASSITDIIVYYNDIPNAPTLALPANGATSVAILPQFRLGSSDENPYQKYFRYKIEVCSTSNCSSIVRTIDQTSSQTGWIGQSQANGTAYGAGGSIVEYAVHNYQLAALSANTQYWWRGYAIDPEGSNTWSSASAISTFTTGVAVPTSVNITGSTNIRSGSTISP